METHTTSRRRVKRFRGIAAILVAAVFLLSAALPAFADGHEPPPPGNGVIPPWIDIEGPTRFDTAIEASRWNFVEVASTVIIATGRNWPDALGGTALAGVLDAPILLVETNSIPPAVIDEIVRLGAQNAIILGGPGAVGPAVEAELVALLGAEGVRRIGGADRYETANMVANEVRVVWGVEFPAVAFVATGGTFHDALAAAPIAARMGMPILLAHPTTGLSPQTAHTIADWMDSTVILGGPAAVSTAVEDTLINNLGAANVLRLGGENAFGTAVEVADFAVANFGFTWNYVGITTGIDFADALTGGVTQGSISSVMLLTTPGSLHSVTAAALTANAAAIDTVIFYGGIGAVSPAVRSDVIQIIVN